MRDINKRDYRKIPKFIFQLPLFIQKPENKGSFWGVFFKPKWNERYCICNLFFNIIK